MEIRSTAPLMSFVATAVEPGHFPLSGHGGPLVPPKSRTPGDDDQDSPSEMSRDHNRSDEAHWLMTRFMSASKVVKLARSG